MGSGNSFMSHNSFLFSFLYRTIFLCSLAAGALAQQATPLGAKPVSAGSAPAPSQAASPDMTRPTLPPGIDPKTMMPLYETIQEDWSSLAIGASKLQPEEPVVAIKDAADDTDTFTRTLVSVKWRPGDPIDLWILLPKGVNKPPAVLYLYGYDQDTDRFRNDRWATRVTSGGVAAVGFVSALSGHRFHDRPMKQWFVSELQESLGSTVHDVKFILDYLAQRGDIDMERIGMFGEGSGGAIAILAAAADPRIKAVDALEPWGDWPDFLAKSSVVQQDPERAAYVKPEFLKKVAPLDPVKWLPELKIPIRVQQIHQQASTSDECKDSIKAALPKQAELVRFEAISDIEKREGSGGLLFEWIKAWVQAGGKTEAKPKVSMADGNPAHSGSTPSHP
jgi:cephalosporin-C deacetylase-like acetyl esterase